MNDNDGCLVFIVLLAILFNTCDTQHKVYDIKQKVDHIKLEIDNSKEEPK